MEWIAMETYSEIVNSNEAINSTPDLHPATLALAVVIASQSAVVMLQQVSGKSLFSFL